jgi:hypothetical protein
MRLYQMAFGALGDITGVKMDRGLDQTLDFAYIEDAAHKAAGYLVENLINRHLINLTTLIIQMKGLANRDNPDFDEELLATMNTKLTALIITEIGDDQALFDFSEVRNVQKLK